VTLTIAFITSRNDPKWEWFFDSLSPQLTDPIDLFVIDLFQSERKWPENNTITKPTVYIDPKRFNTQFVNRFLHVPPKPSVWQGEHRLTSCDWWAKSNAMNTAICLCETDYIAFVDDRCILTPTWLSAIKRAMENTYAVCGAYEKRANMKVENGVIVEEGEFLGGGRGEGFGRTHDWYGGSYGVPLEWCLQVNGWSEDVCDGLGSEDSMFGMTLRNSGLPMYYDSDLKIIEDRTPTEIDGALKRADKNSHLGQKAKSWDIVRIFKDKTDSQNSYCIRNMRDRILLNNEEFPLPSANDRDWYDQQLLSEMQ
jgi:hypothetical protein